MKRYTIWIIVVHCILLSIQQSTAQIIHVPANWATIQEGIDASQDGDTILVADGTYFENINFNGKRITVASHFLIDGNTNHINNTVIDGSEAQNPDYSSVVTLVTGEDTTSVLCGFTITGGTGTLIPEDTLRYGGGIFCYFATAKIQNNKVINNECVSDNEAGGGGIYCWDESPGKWSIIENNIINGNYCLGSYVAGGGGIVAGNNARIKNNVIENNFVDGGTGEALGGGVLTQTTEPSVDTIYLINNTIRENFATSEYRARGGGLSCNGNYLIMRNNIFKRDSLYGDRTNGGGAFIYNTVYAEMTDNLITENVVNKINIFWGAGVFCQAPHGPVYASHNEFSYNTGDPTSVGAGGGFSIYNAFDHLVVIEGNKFESNRAYHGGGFYERSCYNLRIINNIFTGNSAYMGGAMGMLHGAPGDTAYYPLVMNNTFCYNSVSDNGGAIRYSGEYGSIPMLYNCIFWKNDGPAGAGIDINNLTDDTIYVYYSDIETLNISGIWDGGNNIFEDPSFEASDTAYYQLTEGSPCIDAGIPDTNGLGLPQWDIIFNFRLWDGNDDQDTIIDMGAYEYGANSVMPSITQINTLQSTLGIHPYPNPTRGLINLRLQVSDWQYVSCMIYDFHGKKVADVLSEKLTKGEHILKYDLSNLPKGVYVVRVVAEKEAGTGKILLVK